MALMTLDGKPIMLGGSMFDVPPPIVYNPLNLVSITGCSGGIVLHAYCSASLSGMANAGDSACVCVYYELYSNGTKPSADICIICNSTPIISRHASYTTIFGNTGFTVTYGDNLIYCLNADFANSYAILSTTCVLSITGYYCLGTPSTVSVYAGNVIP